MNLSALARGHAKASRPLVRTLVVATALIGVCVPTAASASSIVYEKGGNVFLSTPDGSRQRPITSAGGFSDPSQADDGTIVALSNEHLYVFSPRGALLAGPIPTVATDPRTSGERFAGPYEPEVSPDGSMVAFSYFHISSSGYITSGVGFKALSGPEWDPKVPVDDFGPAWYSSSRVVTHRPGGGFFSAQIATNGPSGNGYYWFSTTENSSVLEMEDLEVNRQHTRLVGRTDAGNRLLLYSMSAPPPDPHPSAVAPTWRCSVIEPVGGEFGEPTWGPDGADLAWAEGDGIWTGRVNEADCSLGAQLRIPGGRTPDWGPSDVPPDDPPPAPPPGPASPGSAPPPGPAGPGSAPPSSDGTGTRPGPRGGTSAGPRALAASAAKKVKRGRTLSVRFTAPAAGRLQATLLRKGRTVTTRRTAVGGPKTATLKLKVPRKARPGGYRVRVVFAAADRSTRASKTLKLRVVR